MLGMLKTESRRFTESAGVIVSKVKVNSDVEKEWYWLMKDCNPANLGARMEAKPEYLISGYDYWTGMGWRRRPESEWPCKRSYGQAPDEEMQKGMVTIACHMVFAEGEQGGSDPFRNLKGELERLKLV